MTPQPWLHARAATLCSVRARKILFVGVLCSIATPQVALGQTVRGTLVDAETSQSIPFGLVLMFTERGDSVGATLSDADGDFTISSPVQGSFVLRAVALGYDERAAGVFDIGEGGVVSLRYGLHPRPLPIDALVVSLERPATLHHLVRNGFVRRLQRGLGVFITPYEIERSSVRSTEQLLTGLPGIRVGPAYTKPTEGSPDVEVGVLLPRPDIGETILVNGPTGWCVPTLYVDGVRSQYDPDAGLTLSNLAGIGEVEGIEVYRRSAEIPVEYSSGARSNCGVIVAWTKTGPAPGRRSASDGALANDGGALPAAKRRGAPPATGEHVRMEIRSAGRTASPMTVREGDLVGFEDGSLVLFDATIGRNVIIPAETIGALQVRRTRAPHYAYLRGGLAGLGMSATIWGGLSFLCAWSECNGAVERAWLPAAVGGGLVAYLAFRRGPGTEWVASAVPEIRAGPNGVSVYWIVPGTGSRR